MFSRVWYVRQSIASWCIALSLAMPIVMNALDSEDRVVVAGFVETDFQNLRDTLFSVSRYTATGLIDTSFASGGIATLDFLRHGIAMDVETTIENDEDKIVVVGTAIDPVVGLPRAIIAKFNADGSLDTAFNAAGSLAGGPGWGWLVPGRSVGNGIAIGDPFTFGPAFPDGYYSCGSIIRSDNRYQAFSVQTDRDGASPTIKFSNNNDTKANALITPYMLGKRLINGTPQPWIGRITIGFISNTFLSDLNGEFLDGAFATFASNDARLYAVGTHANKGILARFDFTFSSPASLPLDTSFGSNGYVIAEFGNQQTTFNAVKVDVSGGPDNERIFVCGTARSLESRMFVAAYDSSGNLIPTFGDNGIQTILEGPNVQTIASDLILPATGSFFENFECPTGASQGLFAVGNANGQSPLIANLSCSGGALEQASYGDKGIASLETEALTDTTVLKEQFGTAVAPFIPSMSPALRRFNTLEGNPFAVSLTAANGFTLEPGRYYLEAEAPMQDVGTHQLQLFNTTLGQQQDVGDTVWNSSGILTKALIKTMVFVPELTRFELRHFFANTGLNFAAGRAAGISGLATVWAQMQIQQL